jgi:hypothetical protein
LGLAINAALRIARFMKLSLLRDVVMIAAMIDALEPDADATSQPNMAAAAVVAAFLIGICYIIGRTVGS